MKKPSDIPVPTRRPARARTKWKRALVNAGLAAGTLAVVLVGAEIVLRTAFDNKYGKRPAFFVADPVLGWKCSAGLDDTFYGPDFRIRVRTDEHGYRLGRLGPVDFRKQLVVLLGDSNVFGWGVSTEETMASHLDDLVHAASGGRARVVNLGVGGYGTIQYLGRLRNLLRDHPDATIAAVVVVHAPNDPVDNVNSVGYAVGAWKVQDRRAPERSRVHLVNLVRYAIRLAAERRDSGARLSGQSARIHPYLQDMLYAVETVLPRTLPPKIVFEGHEISVQGIGEDDWSIERTLARESLTELQRKLTRAAVESIHTLLSGRTEKILHAVVPTAPDWFVEEVGKILQEARPEEPNGVGFYGRLLDPGAFSGAVLNGHSGGHYTPGFNERWAREMMELLEDQQVLRSGLASPDRPARSE